MTARLLRSFLPLLLLALLVGPASAQEDSLPEPPARYDEDFLPPSFHESRRDSVRQALPEEALAIFFSAPERTRDNDVKYEYRQDSDLYYLTGTTEPASVLLLAPGGITVDDETVTELLFVPPRTEYSETWLGHRLGAERAEHVLGIEKAVSNERFEEIMETLLASDRRLFHLPLPRGIEEGSTLEEQVDFVTSQVEPLNVGGSRLARQGVDLMLSVDDPDSFEELQSVIEERLSEDSFDTPIGQELYRQFTQSASLEEWQAWRQEHIAAKYADDTTLRPVLTRLRMIKTDEELHLLQEAIDITTAAQEEALRTLEPDRYEYEVEAVVEYIFKKNGAEYPGFPSIIGSGPNATVLHYETNRRQMEEGDMVVMDVGAEYHGYSADVTRSAPVGGQFSSEQRAIYELVLEAQEAGIEAAQPGNDFAAPDQAARQVIAEGLEELDLIESASEVRRFFMHGTSHYLGLSVHDVGTGGSLRPGTVITVEPGIYIKPAEDIDEKWWNIGVRIEDDVLITEDGPQVLSEDAPKTVAGIEALMSEETAVGTE